MTVEEALSRELVPTAPLVRVLEGKFGTYEDVDGRIVDRWQDQEFVTFSAADRLLCRAGVHWRDDPELSDLYYRVDLSRLSPRGGEQSLVPPVNMIECEQHDCNVLFPKIETRGRAKRRFCSKSCAKRAERARKTAA